MTDFAYGRWPPYHWLEDPEIEPIVVDFWRAKYEDNDLAMYNRFIDILRLSKSGLNDNEISRVIHKDNVRKYLSGSKMSFLTRLRAEHERLGPPRPTQKWLPSHLKPRGTPGTTWIEVPNSPLTFQSVKGFIERFSPRPMDSRLLPDFGFGSPEELQRERTNLFGFFLGAVVGDSGKRLKGATRFTSRSLSLVLSKNKPNSLRFGEFTSFCANATLGLDMHRVSDLPISDKRYGRTECFAWNSSASPINSWIFNDCLGLRDGETTTYDSLRMDWLVDAPRDFGVHFIQGLAESDGWPNAGENVVKVVSSPNTQLFQRLLENLGCPSHKVEQPPVQLLRCSTEDAVKLPFFSPRVSSNLYLDLQSLAHARRYPQKVHLPPSAIDMICELSKATTNANEICLKLAKTTGYKVSANTVRKYSELSRS